MNKDKVRVDSKFCKQCGLCNILCPKQVFGPKGELVNNDQCNQCGYCQLWCPERAITLGVATSRPRAERILSERRGGWALQENTGARHFFLSGNEACALGAFHAGCRFFAGYPITPASDLADAMREQFDPVESRHSRSSTGFDAAKNGIFIQMEDEISAIAAISGASWAGIKSKTATSGPGFSLMQENIEFSVATETPCVIINVQRAGPSTGQPTRSASGDLMQAIWGSNPQKIVLAPTNSQDCYDLTFLAFNLSEMFRVPVIVLTDEILAHLQEKIKIPERECVFNRIYRPNEKPFGPSSAGWWEVASMPRFGDGEELTITGATHYFDGSRAVVDSDAQQRLLDHLAKKMKTAHSYALIDDLPFSDDPPAIPPKTDTLVIAYGLTARSTREAIRKIARQKTKKTKLVVLKRLWPFPFEELERLKLFVSQDVRVVVPEMNQGQLIHFVRQVFQKAELLTQTNGLPIEPSTIEDFLKRGC